MIYTFYCNKNTSEYVNHNTGDVLNSSFNNDDFDHYFIDVSDEQASMILAGYSFTIDIENNCLDNFKITQKVVNDIELLLKEKVKEKNLSLELEQDTNDIQTEINNLKIEYIAKKSEFEGLIA